MRRLLPLLAAFLLTAPAGAAPRTIDDCEAIKEADAYNLCLASFGPTRGQRGKTYPGVASEGQTGKRKAASAHRGGGFGYRSAVSYGRGGRVRMEFTPGRR
ncbi:hypothetical protein [Methylocystis sp. ATCC 49242]|uniref:hypothetical protein n=1 Tax=Methylocystis sp. ATCC 49242 TaxID=622637 RepID=UPI0001F87A05|nr:hypothetical protein [Methylocystis sp. ATCC 49242]